jgi:hypothetical protein
MPLGIYIGNDNGVSITSSGSRNWTPQNIVLTVIAGGIRITWLVRNNTLETEVWIKQDLGDLVLITTTGFGIETYDYLCDAGHDYTVELRAKLDDTILSVPTGFTAVDQTGGIVRLTCDAVIDADHYVWSANIAGAGHSVIAITVNPTYVHNVGGSTQVLYKVRAKEGTLPVYSNYTSEIDLTTASMYDVASSALFTRMTALSETPADARKTIIDTAIIADKAASFWTAKYDAFWLFASHGANSSLLNILTDAINCEKVSTPTVTTDRGIAGAAGKAIKTNFNPSTGVNYTRNNCSIGFYIRNNVGTDTPAASAENSAFHGISAYPRGTANAYYISCNSNYGTGANSDSKGMWIITRDASDHFHIYRNGTEVSAPVKASEALVNLILYFLIQNNNGTLVNGGGNTQELALGFVGAYMSQAEVTSFQTIWVDGYLNSIGAKV